MLKWINKKRNQKGFTLIELIVVIAILGILAAIAIPRFGGFTDQAKKAADESAAATIGKAVELYAISNNSALATPYQLIQADLIDAATLVPKYLPATNVGYFVTLVNGKATVSYNVTANTGAADAAWAGAAVGTPLWPK